MRKIEKQESILDHFPIMLGNAVIGACIADFPLAVVGFSILSSLPDKLLSVRNEKEIRKLLENLNERIDQIEAETPGIRQQLKENKAYQEAAHKRLVAISSQDSEEDLKIYANLIILCGILSGNDPKDKRVLKAISEISAEELKLFILNNKKQNEMEERKRKFSADEKGDHQSTVDLSFEISGEFFKEVEDVLGIYNFIYLLAKIHSLGLIEQPSALTSQDTVEPKVYPPKLTPIGHYFIRQLEVVGFSTT